MPCHISSREDTYISYFVCKAQAKAAIDQANRNAERAYTQGSKHCRTTALHMERKLNKYPPIAFVVFLLTGVTFLQEQAERAKKA